MAHTQLDPIRRGSGDAPVNPAADGYLRRSPVQPLYEAKGYRRKLVLKAVGAIALTAAAGVVIYFLMQLGLLGR